MIRGLAACLLLGGCFQAYSVQPQPVRDLLPGKAFRGKIAGGESHEFHLRLREGQVAEFSLDQFNIDLHLVIRDPADSRVVLLEDGEYGRDRYFYIAKHDGIHTVSIPVDANDSFGGTYVLSLDRIRGLGAKDPERERIVELIESSVSLRDGDAALVLENAAKLARSLADSQLEARALSMLAPRLHRSSNYRRAIEVGRRALSLHRRHGAILRQAELSTELGRLYGQVDDQPKRRAYRRAALLLYRQSPDLRAQALVLGLIANKARESGRMDVARRTLNRMVAVYRLLGDLDGEADSFMKLAQLALDLHDYPKVLDYALKRLQLQSLLGGVRHEAATLGMVGYALKQLGKNGEAVPYFKQAAAIHRMLGDTSAEASVVAELGISEHRNGDSLSGLQHVIWAQRLLEQVRHEVADPKWRTGFRTTTLHQIQIRMELATKSGDNGQAIAAFLAAETDRARYIADGRTSLKEIQQELLDRESAYISFFVASPQSYGWIVTQSSFRAFTVADYSKIDPLARRIRDVFRSRPSRQASETLASYRRRVATRTAEMTEALREMSTILLSAIPEIKKYRRLIVSANRTLHDLPFATLPGPGQPNLPLVETHELVSAPSAISLILLQRQLVGRPAADEGTIVIGDPVYDGFDTPLPRHRRGIDTFASRFYGTRSIDGRAGPLRRLLFAKAEVSHIQAALPDTACACGFQANRDALVRLQNRRIQRLHVASHAVSDAGDPDRSGIVLSTVDEQGKKIDGFVSFRDIYSAYLPVDLVVLSGCRTSVGKDFVHQGTMTLAGAFLHAGARTVVASLWNVDDEATATLMRYFYDEMVRERRLPAAALQRAQQRMRAGGKWTEPYYWAGFQTQGLWQ